MDAGKNASFNEKFTFNLDPTKINSSTYLEVTHLINTLIHLLFNNFP